MDNQITLIGIVKLLKDENYFILRYLSKNKITKKYENKEIICFHTKETKKSTDAIKNGMVLLITGQIYSTTNSDNLIVQPQSYHVLKEKTGQSDVTYLIKFGVDYNRIQIEKPTDSSVYVTHPKPVKNNIITDGRLKADDVEKLNIPVFMKM